MAHFFDPLTIRDLQFSNRVFVSPMREYSSIDGYANDWHFVHLGNRAVGGAGLVLTEATAVVPEGRIREFAKNSRIFAAFARGANRAPQFLFPRKSVVQNFSGT